MLYYEFGEDAVVPEHPMMMATRVATEEEIKLWNEVLIDPVRLSLWNASTEGDTLASAALVDWYQERGIFEKKVDQ